MKYYELYARPFEEDDRHNSESFITVIATPTTRIEQLYLLYKVFIIKDTRWMLQSIVGLSLWRKWIRSLVVMWEMKDCYLLVLSIDRWNYIKMTSSIVTDA